MRVCLCKVKYCVLFSSKQPSYTLYFDAQKAVNFVYTQQNIDTYCSKSLKWKNHKQYIIKSNQSFQARDKSFIFSLSENFFNGIPDIYLKIEVLCSIQWFISLFMKYNLYFRRLLIDLKNLTQTEYCQLY